MRETERQRESEREREGGGGVKGRDRWRDNTSPPCQQGGRSIGLCTVAIMPSFFGFYESKL